jgi:tetratricopeptide (TPR) repeat protein
LVTVIVAFFIYIPARGLHETIVRPLRHLYFGFGFGYLMPVKESQFIKENYIDGKLFNSYNVGSYLIYDLYPQRKVFIDPRYFPYKDFLFEKYMGFRNGLVSLEEMESEFGFDIALIDHSEPILKSFMESNKWQADYYDLSGVVFSQTNNKTATHSRQIDKSSFDNLKNILQAADIVVTAQNLGDYHVASHVINIMKVKLNRMVGFDFFYQYCDTTQKGLNAYDVGNYDAAYIYLSTMAGRNYANLRASKTLKNLAKIKITNFHKEKQILRAFKVMSLMLRYYPNDRDILYNIGIIHYLLQKSDQRELVDAPDNLWRVVLKKLLLVEPDYLYQNVARALLANDSYHGTIPLALSLSNDI